MTACDVALTGYVSIRLSIDKVDSSGGPRSEFPCPIMMHCTPCTRVWIYIWYVWNSRERYILLLSPSFHPVFFQSSSRSNIYPDSLTTTTTPTLTTMSPPPPNDQNKKKDITTASGPLNLLRPFLLLSYSAIYIFPTIIHLVCSFQWGAFFSFAEFKEHWFSRFWAFFGPKSRDFAAPVVLPLLERNATGVCLDIGESLLLSLEKRKEERKREE